MILHGEQKHFAEIIYIALVVTYISQNISIWKKKHEETTLSPMN